MLKFASSALAALRPTARCMSLVHREPSLVVPSGVNTGVPTPLLVGRSAIISKKTRNAMTSGTGATDDWTITFEHTGHWSNPLLGYSSTSDAVGQLKIIFPTKESAVKYADKAGYAYTIEEPHERRKSFKAYDAKFKWRGLPKKPEDDI